MFRNVVPALLAILLAVPPARGTVVEDRSLSELSRLSHLVVRATVTGQQVQWDEQHQFIVTRTFLAPSASLKGTAPGRVVVRQVGGELDGQRLHVEGAARFRIGEDVVLFLERHPVAKGEFVLQSMAASKFTVVPTQSGPVVQRSLSGLTLARRDRAGTLRPTELAPDNAPGLPWAAFLRDVRAGAALPAPAAPGTTAR